MLGIQYAHSKNAQRCSITTSLFYDYVNVSYPRNDSDVGLTQIYKYDMVIESTCMMKNNERFNLKQKYTINMDANVE